MLVLVLAVAISTIPFPKVKAQSTSITNLQAPSAAIVGRDVHIKFTVSYSPSSDSAGIGIGIADADTHENWVAGNIYISTPNGCAQGEGAYANIAYCYFALSTTPAGSVNVDFVFSPQTPRTYHLEAAAFLDDSSGNQFAASISRQPFSITVSRLEGQQVTTEVATNEVYNQPFDLPPSELVLNDNGGGTRYCSMVALPDSGVSLSAGDRLTGEVTANNPVHMAIVTTFSSGGQGGCNSVLGTQLYSNDGTSFQFQWTATSSGVFYVALLNARTDVEITGSISVFEITHQEFTQELTTNTTTSVTHVTSTTSSLQMPQPPQTAVFPQYTINTSQLALALAVIAAVVLGALFLYSRRRGQPKVTPAEKVDTDATRLPTKPTPSKRLCTQCGNELSPNLRFCDSCGTEQP